MWLFWLFLWFIADVAGIWFKTDMVLNCSIEFGMYTLNPNMFAPGVCTISEYYTLYFIICKIHLKTSDKISYHIIGFGFINKHVRRIIYIHLKFYVKRWTWVSKTPGICMMYDALKMGRAEWHCPLTYICISGWDLWSMRQSCCPERSVYLLPSDSLPSQPDARILCLWEISFWWFHGKLTKGDPLFWSCCKCMGWPTCSGAIGYNLNKKKL